MEDALKSLQARLAESFGADAYGGTCHHGVVVASDRLAGCLKHLHDIERFDYLRDMTAVDWLHGRRTDIPSANRPASQRFDIVYQLANLAAGLTLSVKSHLDDGESVPSAVPLWPTAEFLEREVFDLMGVGFTNHPDLRRILLSDDWEGHPLRKDYPVSGYDMWNWEGRR